MSRRTMSIVPPTAQAADLALRLQPERPEDSRRVDAIIEHAFGPGRLVKTAERLREHNAPLLDLSQVAWVGDEAVGCCRMWPVRIGDTPAVLLGPFAVEDAWRSRGLGAQLIEAACAAAARAQRGVIILVGDEPYFRKLGFEQVPVGAAVMPGPVNPRRLLWRALRPGALEGVRGEVRPG
jgi:predicted N-acetyltransferase YhbS